MPPPTPSARDASTCRAQVAALPDKLAGLSARLTDPASPFTRAWGSPAIVLRCGVARPAYPPDAQFLGVNGVDWYPREEQHDVVWTTPERRPFLEVTVPNHYQQQADVISPISAALRSRRP